MVVSINGMAAMGDGDGGSTTAMSNSGGGKMDDRTVAGWQCVALQSQWMMVAAMGNGGEAAT
jgi:hypothetical protein